MINYDNELIKILKMTEKEAYKLNHTYIGSEHLLLAILKSKNDISKILSKYSITYEQVYSKVKQIKVKKENTHLIYTPFLKRKLLYSANDNTINIKNIFLKILEEGEGLAYSILNDFDIKISDLYRSILDSKFKYGILLNDEVKNQNEMIYGRDKEINDIIEILLRKNKNNPILIGKAGVGKTAIVEELANRINKKNIPKELFNKKIYSINLSEIISGTKYRGEFEEKINNLIKEAESDDNIILFIDEIHTLIGAGGAEGAIDASNILKPYLARNKIKCIGATTEEEYEKTILKDKALNRRFYKIEIKEPSKEETINIINNVKKYYELYHNVYLNKKQIRLIVNLSEKYIKNKYEPDKSLDVLDKICTKAKLNNHLNNNVNNLLNILNYEKSALLKSKNFKQVIEINNKIKNLNNKKIFVNNLFIKECFDTNQKSSIGFKI